MAFRSASTPTTGNGTALSIAKPTGVAVDDIVILLIAIDVATATCTTPTGFTAYSSNGQASPDGENNFAFWRRFDGSEGANITATMGGGGDDWIMQCVAFSGRDTSNPPVAVLTTPNTSSNASPVSVALTGVTAVAGDDIVWWGSLDKTSNSVAWTYTPPTNYTEASDTNNGWSAASIAYRENVSSGTTGTLTGTATGGGGTAGFAGYVIRIPSAGGSSNTTIAPSVGSISLSGIAPTLTTAFTRIAAVGALAIAGIAPTVSVPGAIVPVAGSLTLTGVSPGVTQQLSRVPTVGSLTLTGIAPTVTRTQSIQPTAGSLAFTGYDSPQTLGVAPPSAGGLVISGLSPTVTQGSGPVTRTPLVGTLTLSGNAPTLNGAVSISPSTVALTISGVSASVTQQFNRTGALGSLTLTGIAPGVTQQILRSPNAGALVLSGNVVGINGALLITPSTALLNLIPGNAFLTDSTADARPDVIRRVTVHLATAITVH